MGPPGSDASGGSGDASGAGSDAAVDMMMIDAMPAACAEAIEVFADMVKRSSTCLGFDRLDGCGPDATEEVVFKWVVPASGGYQISSTNIANGTIQSTGRVNAACTTATMCSGITQTPFTAGQVVYLALEAPAGGCATYDLSIVSM